MRPITPESNGCFGREIYLIKNSENPLKSNNACKQQIDIKPLPTKKEIKKYNDDI